jgi:pre-rRNA-processing protein IPI3
MSVWRWDKKEPVVRFPVKEVLTVVRFSPGGAALCLAGSKSGRIYVWEVLTGQLLGEVEGAHYLDITDMDIAVTNDLVITGGKDFKVKVWILTE